MRIIAVLTIGLVFACRSTGPSGVSKDLGIEGASTLLFDGTATFPVTIEAPIGELNQDQSFTEGANREGFIVLADGRRLAIKLTVRGQTSFRVCRFKKFEIEFGDPNTLGSTPFKGQKSFDLATHCDKDPESKDVVRLGDARAVGREQTNYRMLTELTPASRRTRFLDVTYIDSVTGTRETFPGFALEEFRSVRKRLNAEKADTPVAYLSMDQPSVALAFFFNIMVNNADLQIGNLTFGGVKQDLQLHNAKTINIAGKLIAVPYDFDIAGAVVGFSNDPFTADFHPKFLAGSSSTLKQMAFRVILMRKVFDPATFAATIALFKMKEATMRQLVAESHADDEGKQLLVSYLDAFYTAINDTGLKLPMLRLPGVAVYKNKQKTAQFCSNMPGGLPVVVRQKSGARLMVQMVTPYVNDAPGCAGIPDFDEVPVTKELWVDATSVDGTVSPLP